MLDSDGFISSSAVEACINEDVTLTDKVYARLRYVESFAIGELNRDFGNTASTNLSIWRAMERCASEDGRRFVRSPSTPGYYITGTPEQCIKRTQKRRRAASRVLERQTHEVQRLLSSAAKTSETHKILLREESRLADMLVRQRASQQEKSRKKPAGI